MGRPIASVCAGPPSTTDEDEDATTSVSVASRAPAPMRRLAGRAAQTVHAVRVLYEWSNQQPDYHVLCTGYTSRLNRAEVALQDVLEMWDAEVMCTYDTLWHPAIPNYYPRVPSTPSIPSIPPAPSHVDRRLVHVFDSGRVVAWEGGFEWRAFLTDVFAAEDMLGRYEGVLVVRGGFLADIVDALASDPTTRYCGALNMGSLMSVRGLQFEGRGRDAAWGHVCVSHFACESG